MVKASESVSIWYICSDTSTGNVCIQIGHSSFGGGSLKILGLGFGATEAELKHSFRRLSRVYHPDKHKPEETGLSLEEATAHFQLLNNAYSYLREKI